MLQRFHLGVAKVDRGIAWHGRWLSLCGVRVEHGSLRRTRARVLEGGTRDADAEATQVSEPRLDATSHPNVQALPKKKTKCGIMHAQDTMLERARMSDGVRTCARCCARVCRTEYVRVHGAAPSNVDRSRTDVELRATATQTNLGVGA
jgi:hypothetical protein